MKQVQNGLLLTRVIGICWSSHTGAVLLWSNDASRHLSLAFQRRWQLVETEWYVSFEWRRVGKSCEDPEWALPLEHVSRCMRPLDRVRILHLPHWNWLWQSQKPASHNCQWVRQRNSCYICTSYSEINYWSTHTHTHTHTHTILTAILPGKPGLAGCPHNSRSPFILELSILWGED